MTGATPDRTRQSADVVVVGAGIVGLSTAFQLAHRGVHDVVVLERSHIGAVASGKSGAIVRTHYPNAWESRLAKEGLEYFRNWSDVVGGDCPFTQTGLLVIVPEFAQRDLVANIEMQRSLGIEAAIVDPVAVRDIDPDILVGDGELVGYEPFAGVVDGLAACNSLAEKVTAMGVEIQLDTEVRSIDVVGGRVTGVTTDAARIACERVVIAPGAFAHTILRPLGIDLPMIPATSRIAIFRWPRDRDPRHPVLFDHIRGLWLRPIYGDSTLIGAERGVRREVDDPARADETIDQAYVEHCRAHLAGRYPVMAHAVNRGGWTGIVMRSADDRPILGGFDGVEGLWGLVGDSGTCFKTAPALGRVLAELAIDGATDTDISPFAASRFRDGGRWIDEHQYPKATSSPPYGR